jgi:drug/metabolite transporter (DMT)-like permease
MPSRETMAVIYGLASAMTWGAGDFGGGLASRRSQVRTVLILSQCAGILLLLGLALFLVEPFPPPSMLWTGAMAGVAGVVGLLSLYSGLASGRMGLVAPVAALITGVLPLLASFAMEGMPGTSQTAGFAAALLAVWLLSRGGGEARISPRELGLAAVAGLGFGLTFILIDRFADSYLFWPLVASRVASISLLLLVTALSRERVWPRPRQLPLVGAAGILDVLGNLFFGLATAAGRLDISAVLSSLYPASTVLLAWLILKERLAPSQGIGVLVALIALVLITA